MTDLEFYPMTHGDPRSGDWVLLRDEIGSEVRARCDDKIQGFVGKDGYLFDDDDEMNFVGWLPIAYYRPAVTRPEDPSCITCIDGRWMPYPIDPPTKPAAPANPLATVSDAELIAELKRRIGGAK